MEGEIKGCRTGREVRCDIFVVNMKGNECSRY